MKIILNDEEHAAWMKQEDPLLPFIDRIRNQKPSGVEILHQMPEDGAWLTPEQFKLVRGILALPVETTVAEASKQ
jgi:hypothetical protein